METGPAANANSAAISAYSRQQDQRTVARLQNQSQSSNSQVPDANQTADANKKTKADQVKFSHEALVLAQSDKAPSQASNTVNQANSTPDSSPYPPQNAGQQHAYQAASAHSVAQAIIKNYQSTFNS
jgi:hypothetical protein